MSVLKKYECMLDYIFKVKSNEQKVSPKITLIFITYFSNKTLTNVLLNFI